MVRSKLSLKLIGDKKRRKTTFAKRRTGLENKARELSTLCDIPVLLVCVGPEGKDELIWPKDRDEANAIAERFCGARAEVRLKHRYDISSFFGDAVMKQAIEVGAGGQESDVLGCSSDGQLVLDLMPESSLEHLEQALEARLREIEERMGALGQRDGFQFQGSEQSASKDDWDLPQPDDHVQGEQFAALPYYDLSGLNTPGEEILQNAVGSVDWGYPTGCSFDEDPIALCSGLQYQNLLLQPLLNGGETEPPPMWSSGCNSTSFQVPALQALTGNVSGTTVYADPSTPWNSHLLSGAGALIVHPSYPHEYSALNYPDIMTPARLCGGGFSDYGSEPCVTRLPHFLSQQLNAAAGRCIDGAAREQAAGGSSDDISAHWPRELYGEATGFLDHPEQDGLEKPWGSPVYPDHLSACDMALTQPFPAGIHWAGFPPAAGGM